MGHALLIGMVAGAAATMLWGRPRHAGTPLAGGPAPTGATEPAPSGATAGPATAPAAAGNGAVEELRASKSQARGTWISAAVATVALLASLFTLSGQVRINAQQIDLNTEADKRAAQVYASRVAVWYTDGLDATSTTPAGLDVTVQNMSPATIDNVRIIASLTTAAGAGAGDAEIAIGAVRPCSASALRIGAPPGTRFHRDTDAVTPQVQLKLAFTETNRDWYLDGANLVTLDDTNRHLVPPYGVLPPFPTGRKVTTSQVADCGEAF